MNEYRYTGISISKKNYLKRFGSYMNIINIFVVQFEDVHRLGVGKIDEYYDKNVDGGGKLNILF